jgi:hypothetical protein
MGSPETITNYLTQNNPYFRQAAEYVAKNGGNINNVDDIKSAMEKALKEQGKDIAETYNALR